MRLFIIAIVILLFIITAISVNSVYIIQKTDRLLDLCDIIENDSSAQNVDQLTREWQNCRDIIALAVHRTELERAEDAILALKCYLEAPSEFKHQLALLKSALEHISVHQKITFDSIL